MKILPTGKSYYITAPITDSDGNYIEGVIDVSEGDILGILDGTHCFTEDLSAVRILTESEISELQAQKELDEACVMEADNKILRICYMDAYRKYQAAVNYGEYQKIPTIDSFIAALQAKNWAALNSVPNALKYFTGECGFAESGLIKVNSGGTF